MSRQRLRRAIEAATTALGQAGIDSARNDAELLAAHVLGVERGRLSFADVPEEFFGRYRDAVSTRARRIPLQHITGTAPFGSVRLEVGPGVFIPRPETEALLEWALAQDLPDDAVIVDVCTGSGALGIALAASRPGARVTGVDIDPTALDYARRNAAVTTMSVVQGDVAEDGLLPDLAGTVDLVVSNPPYVPVGVILEPEVAEHDPAHAVFGGADGMAVIVPLVARAASWLKSGGLLAVEHDDTTSEATVDAIGATGLFDQVVPHTDLAGRPRFVTGRRRPRTPEGDQT
ncbi:MAG: peptide chain release factor N(5)-glutamine methyltransferase [Mycobacterium sp.]